MNLKKSSYFLLILFMAALLAKTSACGGQLVGPSGTFSSPDYPQQYPSNTLCLWRVNLTRGSTLNVAFIRFHTERCCDILTVRNGSSLITSLSGNQGNVTVQPITAVDDNTVIVIAFSSDLTVSEKGFKAHFDITTSSAPTTPIPTTPAPTEPPFFGCGGMLNGSSGSFGTPGYPLNYDNNLNCVWTLLIPIDRYLRLKFIVFHTEQCCDFVELNDSAGQRIERFSGYKPYYSVTVHGSRTQLLRVIFTSDSSVRRKGFLAQYHITLSPPNSSVLASSPVVPFTTHVTALPTLSSPGLPIRSSSAVQPMTDTALPTLSSPVLLSSFPFQSTPATGIPTFSSAPFTTFTVEPSSAILTPVMSSSITLVVTLPPEVQRVLVNLLSSLSQIILRLQALLQGPISPDAFANFQNETMQILQQIEDQLVSDTPTQPSNMQMAKRAIRELLDPQELVKLLEKIQQKLLG